MFIGPSNIGVNINVASLKFNIYSALPFSQRMTQCSVCVCVRAHMRAHRDYVFETLSGDIKQLNDNKEQT